MDMLDLGNPDINGRSLPESMGVEEARAETAEGSPTCCGTRWAQRGRF